jgi:hypothetical protein
MHECHKVAHFRADIWSPDWIGYAVATVLNIDIHENKKRNKEGCAKVSQVVKT